MDASYTEYLMPGIFVQTLTFASATTAIGMTEDLHKGIIDRFRSLPMARSAVLFGRSVSDVIYNGGILIVLMVTGLVVGWSVNAGIPAVPVWRPALSRLRLRDVVGRASGWACGYPASRSPSRFRSWSSCR